MGRRRSKWKNNGTCADRNTLLLQFAKNGDCSALDDLIAREWPFTDTLHKDQQDLSVNDIQQFLQQTQDHNGSTALHLAASEGRCVMIEKLLQLGAGEMHLSGGRKRYARTPLHEASMNGHLDACRLLVKAGFLIDCHTTRARTPLMYAVKGNHLNVVKYLIQECHANINEQNEMGMTPLYIACQKGHEAIVQYLIDQKANVNLSNRTHHAPLHVAVAGGFGAIVSLLIDAGADKHVVDDMGVTIWHEAAGHGSVALLDLLVHYQVSLSPCGHTQLDKVLSRHPFHYAAVEGKAEFLQGMLVKKLVDVNMVDSDGCTAIYYASANGHVHVLQVLLAHGGDPNLVSIRRSSLHCAVEWQRLDCIKLLLAHGARMDALDQDGKTPLELANAQNNEWIYTCFHTK